MARGVNKVILVGRVGQDPEVKYMPNGGAVANLSIATNEEWKDKNTGEKQVRTEWHRLTAYQKLAEIIGEYVKKGAEIYVEGSLKTRKWQAQDGTDRYTTEIIVSEMQMLGGKPSEGNQSSAPAPQQQRQAPAPAQRQQAPQQPQAGFDQFSDDIPF